MSFAVTLELMMLADHYVVDDLKAYCESQLMQQVSPLNVCKTIVVAHRCSASELRKHCLDIILASSEIALDELADEPALLMEITKASLARRG